MEVDLNGCRVLVLEDQYYLAQDLSDLLSGLGAEVVGPVPRIEHALEIISRDEIDLALLDIKLADGTSYEVARELRRRGLPFVFVTAYAPAAVEKEFSSIPCVSKPLGRAEILDALQRIEMG